MNIQTLHELIHVCERYIKITNEHGEDITISAIPQCNENAIAVEFSGHMGETWLKKIWIDDKKEAHIEDLLTHESIFNYAKEFGWSEHEVRYIKTCEP